MLVARSGECFLCASLEHYLTPRVSGARHLVITWQRKGTNMTTTQTETLWKYIKFAVPAEWFEDEDDCLAAAEEHVERRFGVQDWQVEAKWADDARNAINVTVYTDKKLF